MAAATTPASLLLAAVARGERCPDPTLRALRAVLTPLPGCPAECPDITTGHAGEHAALLYATTPPPCLRAEAPRHANERDTVAAPLHLKEVMR